MGVVNSTTKKRILNLQCNTIGLVRSSTLQRRPELKMQKDEHSYCDKFKL